jgi:hypothetical protein
MTSVRNHPLEGAGCRITFYQYLMRVNDVASIVKVRIPTTVLFEHSCPRAWYDFDDEIREVRRQVGKDLQATSIYNDFMGIPNKANEGDGLGLPPVVGVDQHSHSSGAHRKGAARVGGMRREGEVIASFTYVQEAASEEPVVGVIYLTAEELRDFLTKPNPLKRQGILQKFIPSLETNETVIQASWSPRVCLLRRRTSRRGRGDHRHPVSERYVTFDGPDHLSVEGACSKETVRVFGSLCEDIADHLYKTQHLKVANMILFFKQNQNVEPVLLWCGGLQFQGFRTATPLQATLSLLESGPRGDDAQEIAARKVLSETDKHHKVLLTEFKSPRRRVLFPAAGRSNDQKTEDGAGGPNSNSQGGASSGSVSGGADSAFFRRRRIEELRKSIKGLCETWYKMTDEIEEEYLTLVEHERAVQAMVEDTLYLAMSQRVETTHPSEMSSAMFASATFKPEEEGDLLRIRFPPELSRYLSSPEHVASLIKAMGLVELPSGDISLSSRSSKLPPIPTIISAARNWIADHFRERMFALRMKASGQVQLAAVKLALQAAQNAATNGASSTGLNGAGGSKAGGSLPSS